MDSAAMVKFWDELWSKSMWWPAFKTSFENLSPEQAAWKPDSRRHSIWQNLNHICYWREVVVKRLTDTTPPPDGEVEKRNFEEPRQISERAWRESLDRLQRSQNIVREALLCGKLDEERFKFMVPHDAYHVGQVMYLRALQGLPAVSYD